MAQSGEERIGVQLSAVIALLGEKMYSSDIVFARENVQNAIDATRILCRQISRSSVKSEIRVNINSSSIEIEDWGVGMTREDLVKYYWNIGSSSKNTVEAVEAGCIGQFGIGGFANFGVCSEVQIYTTTNAYGENGLYSFVKKEDLQQNRNELVITSTDMIRHRGTLIRCIPLKAFDTRLIIEYLRRYVQYLPERVIVNEELISRKPFLDEYTQNESEEREMRFRFKYGRAEGVIVEYEDRKVTFRPKKVHMHRKEYNVSGEIQIDILPLEVYKNLFLVSDYQYSNKRLSGKLNLPFVKPIASREGFDTATTDILRAFHDSVTDLLITHIAGSRELLGAYRGTPLIDHIYDNENVKTLRNLEVTLLDSTKSTLGEIEEGSKETMVYYLDSKNIDAARALQYKGNIVVNLIELDKKTRWIVQRFLTEYCTGKSVPYALTQDVSEDTLDGDTRFVLDLMREYLKKEECAEITIQPCTFASKEGITVLFKDEERKIFINIGHPDFVILTECTNKSVLSLVLDRFMKDYLQDTFARFRRKVFGPRGRGISFIAPDYEKYKIVIEAVEKVRLAKRGGNPWEGNNTQFIEITGEDFPDMNGYYLRLPLTVAEAYNSYLQREYKIEVIAFLKQLFYVVYYEVDSAVVFEINLDKQLFIPTDDGDSERSFRDTLEKHIIIKPKGTYLPIPSRLTLVFIPRESPRIVFLGPRLEH